MSACTWNTLVSDASNCWPQRVRAALRALAERGAVQEKARADALSEINRVLGRSAGHRRVEFGDDGSFRQSFVPVGDAFAGLPADAAMALRARMDRLVPISSEYNTLVAVAG
jgi:hypothetical protein